MKLSSSILRRFSLLAWLPILVLGCVPSGSLPLPTLGDGEDDTTIAGAVDTQGDANQPTTGGCLALATPTNAPHQGVFDQLNAYRQANGLETLEYSMTLQAAADAHAKDMFDRQFFSHTNPSGEAPADRAVNAGFCHEYCGENIAYGMNQVSQTSEVMQAWKNSPGHDANMLNGSYAYVGVGYYHTQVGVNHYYYWVQLFALDMGD
ncbi:MAG: CAP domain-containing protein [Phycisphaerae bacterium]|nr:CAP domain-containing protein [Phycisphaerae bacterium]